MNEAAVLSEPSSRLARGYLICLTATVIWSTTGIFIGYITQNFNMPPLLLAFWRDLIVSATLLTAFTLLSRSMLRISKNNLAFLAWYGLALTFLNTSWTISVALNGAAVSTVLVYSSPAITALVGWRLYGESLDMAKISAIVLSILGAALVSGAYQPQVWQVNLIGVIAGLLSGVAMAMYSLMGKGASLRQINPWSTLSYTFASATLFLLIINLTSLGQAQGLSHSNLLWLGNTPTPWIVLLILAIGPTIGGYGLYMVSLGYLQASVANLIATLEPVFTAILAYLLLAERLNSIQILGGILIFTGVVLLRMYEGRRK